MVIKCNHILISLYKLKWEAEIACKFQYQFSTPISKARYLTVLTQPAHRRSPSVRMPCSHHITGPTQLLTLGSCVGAMCVADFTVCNRLSASLTSVAPVC